MTAQLNFNLEEYDDIIKYNRCNKSLDLTFCLLKLRNEILKDKDITSDVFFGILDEYNINLEQIIS
jgi:hypothetical protein